ncbi:hypothetical protein GWI33_023094 [Rhynchophorus ferrugineus]|uniref:Uncharacterized protein n=1 Tax=Rhynchophorus ferrugineus TaxID=354439 RepID=A0A834MHG1_RHYFE|nr:hypothetical protein GWI33_023094 [Rhynchophorus ferrugineus]
MPPPVPPHLATSPAPLSPSSTINRIQFANGGGRIAGVVDLKIRRPGRGNEGVNGWLMQNAPGALLFKAVLTVKVRKMRARAALSRLTDRR